MRILIAEDDVTTRNILTAMLNKNGHDVIETKNGEEAWEVMYQPNAPEMAIIDWMMPKMDGLEVVRRVRALQTDLPPYIIMLTTKGEKKDIVAGLVAGADDYIPKPYDQEELSARIDVGQRILKLQANLHAASIALAHEATHDPLTGIHNRKAILDTLSREISRQQRQQGGLAIGICDIDCFKKINDRYGHLVGDDVLCGFTGLMKSMLRPYDYIGRFGGEEFVIVTPGIKGSDVNMLYERFRSSVADNPMPTRDGNVSITVSIGVAVYGGDTKLDELLAAADSALYRAKREGRNAVCNAGWQIIKEEQA